MVQFRATVNSVPAEHVQVQTVSVLAPSLPPHRSPLIAAEAGKGSGPEEGVYQKQLNLQ